MNISRGRIPGAKKVVIYGVEGIGKSTLAAQFPGVLFIDTEGSTKELDVARFDPPTSWAMLLAQVQYVIDHPQICQTLVIDTADWAEQIMIADICSKSKWDGLEAPGYGKGYQYAAEEWGGQLLNRLTEVVRRGVNVVFTAHALLRKVDLPEENTSYDHWEMKTSKKVAPMLREWADMVLFLHYDIQVYKSSEKDKKGKAQGGRRVMETTHTPYWDGKNRYGLPDKLPLDFGQIAQLFTVPTAAVAEGYSVTAPGSAAGACVERTAESRPYRADANNGAPAQVSQATNVSAQSNGTPPHPSALQTPSPQGEGYAGDPLPLITEPDPDVPFTGPSPEPPAGVPQALWDLMQAHGVTEAEIVAAVAQKGYFPPNMRLANYPADFIQGVLIGAWDQVHLMIVNNRTNGKEN